MLIANLYISIIGPERCLKSHRQNVAKFLKTGPECSLIKIQSCSLKIASQNSCNSSWEWLPNSLFIMDFSMVLEKPTFVYIRFRSQKPFCNLIYLRQFQLTQCFQPYVTQKIWKSLCTESHSLYLPKITLNFPFQSYHLISKRHTTMLLVFSLSIDLVSFQLLLLARKLDFKNIIFQSNTTGSIYTL